MKTNKLLRTYIEAAEEEYFMPTEDLPLKKRLKRRIRLFKKAVKDGIRPSLNTALQINLSVYETSLLDKNSNREEAAYDFFKYFSPYIDYTGKNIELNNELYNSFWERWSGCKE